MWHFNTLIVLRGRRLRNGRYRRKSLPARILPQIKALISRVKQRKPFISLEMGSCCQDKSVPTNPMKESRIFHESLPVTLPQLIARCQDPFSLGLFLSSQFMTRIIMTETRHSRTCL